MESDKVGATQPAALLEQVAGGDRGAFAEFYDATAARVYGMVRRILVDPSLSEDVVQEVYLQVWHQAGSFSSAKGSAMAWLVMIAHRRAVDTVRREQARTVREQRYEGAAAVTAHDGVAETVTERAEADRVSNCLESLTRLQHESVRLAYYAGLTYREVADRLQVGLPAIKSRIRDGLIRLKNCLGVSHDG